jgi:hypothetical protein
VKNRAIRSSETFKKFKALDVTTLKATGHIFTALETAII